MTVYSTLQSAHEGLQRVYKALETLHKCLFVGYFVIKTHGSESRGQEEAACTRVFWPTRPLQ